MTSREQILYVLDYLKESGFPCNVTLYYPDFHKFPKVKRSIRINLDKLPNKRVVDIITETRLYYLMIKVGKQEFYIQNNKPDRNQMYIDDIKKLINEEYFINHKRKTRLDGILNDTTPLSLS